MSQAIHSDEVTTPDGVPLDVDPEILNLVKFDANGLVVAVVQDAQDATVLMVGYMNEEALSRTLDTGRAWFWSRSRADFWRKGDTSGDRQYVRAVKMDCDGDALVVVVDQHGKGACHTGNRSCFYRSVGEGPGVPVAPPTPGEQSTQ
jgi:phosphoribosyl-AMP cyclohydrolase